MFLVPLLYILMHVDAILAQHDDNNQENVCHDASRLLKNADNFEFISMVLPSLL